MSDLLEPYTYTPTKGDRFRSVWHRSWHFLLPFVVFIVMTVLVIITNGLWTTPSLIVIAFTLGTLLLGIYVIYYFGVKNFSPEYKILNNVTIQFNSPKWYVPSNKMETFLRENIEPFGKVLDEGDDPMELIKDTILTITDERPVDPGGRIETERMVGLTWQHPRKVSYVYGPYALSRGGAGYEMRLQAMGILFPGQSEGEDIEWMKANELL